MDAEPVMQRDNEISRAAVDGRLVESGKPCKFWQSTNAPAPGRSTPTGWANSACDCHKQAQST